MTPDVSAATAKAIRSELAIFLRSRTLADCSTVACPVLRQYVESTFSTRINNDLDRSTAAVIFLVASMSDVDSVVAHNGHLPLRAAKHLLALGEYPEDTRQLVPETNWRLGDIMHKGDSISNPKPLESPSLRVRIACIAGGFGTSRKMLAASSPYFSEVVLALWERLSSLEPGSQLDAEIRGMTRRINEEIAEAHRRADQSESTVEVAGRPPSFFDRSTIESPSPQLLDRERREIANQIDQSPGFYPSRMKPTSLWGSMSLSLLDGSEVIAGSVDSALRPHRHVVVLGGPGSGKSTILAGRVATHLREGGDGLFISFASLSEELKDGRTSNLNADLAAIVGTHRSSRTDPMDSSEAKKIDEYFLREMQSNPSFLLAIDGLDEVEDARTLEAVFDFLERISHLPGQLVVSSRFAGFVQPLKSAVEFRIESLANPTSFLYEWHVSGTEGRDRIDRLLNQGHLAIDLTRSPLLAGMVASIAEDEEVPNSMGLLYRRFVLRFLERDWKSLRYRRLSTSEVAVLLEVAEELAFTMATAGRPIGVTPGPWLSSSTPLWLHKKLRNHRSEVETLLRTDGLLVPRGLKIGGDVAATQVHTWIHRTFQEHLVGSYLESHWRENREHVQVVIDYAFRNARVWANTLVHLFGLAPPSIHFDLIDDFESAAEKVRIIESQPDYEEGYRIRMWYQLATTRGLTARDPDDPDYY